MKIQQLSIFVENKPGRLVEIAETLAGAGVDIRAFSTADTSDFGILRLIVDRPDAAVDVLRAANLTVMLTEVIAIVIEDKPGSFARVLRILTDAGVNVEYMYAFVSRKTDKANVILRTADTEAAIATLLANNVCLLTAGDVC